MNGKVSDGGIWARCDLRQKLEHNIIDLPPPSNMPNTNTPINYHIVADAAFPSGLQLMKPFGEPQVSVNIPNRIYNYRYV